MISKWLVLTVCFVLAGCGGADFVAFGGDAPTPFDSGSVGGASAGGSTGGKAGVRAGAGGAQAAGGTAATEDDAGPGSAGAPADPAADAGDTDGGSPADCSSCANIPPNGHAACARGRCDFECDNGYTRAGDTCIIAGTPCTLVTHVNGVGQTWQDCVPIGTYNATEAVRACVAYTGTPNNCSYAPGCGDAKWLIQAINPAETYNIVWGYTGNTAGFVGVNGACPNAITGKPWQ